MQIHALAFGAKWGGFTASGLMVPGKTDSAANRPSSFRRQASARVPMPLALVAKKLPRACRKYSWNGFNRVSACSGLFERSRRTQQTLDSGASNVINIG